MSISMFMYILLLICVIGLCFGSFYNVVILRSLSGESIVFPASKCPKCSHKLKPWHNIPILSYLFLRGKCAFCGEKISIQYPIIELVTMLLFVACFFRYGFSWSTLLAIIVVSSMLIMTVTDLKEKLVDCNIAIGMAIIGVLFNGFVTGAWVSSIVGLIVGALIMELIARIGYLFSKGRAFGEADTYVAGALGACFGLQGILYILMYTLIVASLFTVPMFLYNQYKKGQKLICILAVLFTVSALVYKFAFQNWFAFVPFVLLGLALAVLILRNLKTEQSSMALPLVPAFFIATLYFLLF